MQVLLLSFLTGLAVAIVSVQTVLAGAPGKPAELRARFLEEAPIKWKEHERRLREQPLQVTRKTWGRPRGRTEFPGEPFEHLTIKRTVSGSLLMCAFGGNSAEHRCCVVNERYAFELRRRDSSDSWLIRSVDADTNDYGHAPYLTAVLHKDKGGLYCSGPFELYKSNVPSLVKDPNFQATDVSAADHDGARLVRVDFVCPRKSAELKGGQPLEIHYDEGWLLLDPNAYWSLREFQATTSWSGPQGIKTVIRGTLLNTSTRSGLPIPKQQMVWVKGASSRGPSVQLDHEYKTEYTIEEREPARDEFTLSAFGLPEPTWITQPANWLTWVIGGGAFCLAAGVLFFWLRHRYALRAIA